MESLAEPLVKVPSPIAHLFGEPVLELPRDLYIPPEALQVFLETFEGPLDLLLYLIRKQNLDVLDIPMRTVTAQYLAYVEAMTEHQLELAAEYLLMAAMLIDIKSRLLLPKISHAEDGEVVDPRAELVRRLLEYEQMKLAAKALDEMPQAGRDFAWVQVLIERIEFTPLPDVSLNDLAEAWKGILNRANVQQHHLLTQDELSVRETMSRTLSLLKQRGVMEFVDCFEAEASRGQVVVQFLAILELCKESLIQITQERVYGAIFLSLSSR